MESQNKINSSLIDKLPKKWKPAKSFQGVFDRINEIDTVTYFRKGANLTSIKNLFIKVPEIFLFDDLVAEIKTKYLSSTTYMRNNAGVQIANMESALREMENDARSLYKKLVGDDKLNFKDIESKIKNTKEGKQVKKYLRIRSNIKFLFKDDETPIENFIPETAGGGLFKNYLQKRNINTLGNYMQHISNAKSFNCIGTFCSTNCKEDFKIFNENIMNYVNEKIESGEVVVESGSREKDKTNSSLDKQDDSSLDIFEQLKAMPAKNFVDDEKKKKISEKMEKYLHEISDPYVEGGFSEEDVSEVVGDALKKFQEIVKQKKEEYETEQRKASVRAAINKQISDGVKFHHDPKMYSHEERHSKNHFDSPSREL